MSLLADIQRGDTARRQQVPPRWLLTALRRFALSLLSLAAVGLRITRLHSTDPQPCGCGLFRTIPDKQLESTTDPRTFGPWSVSIFLARKLSLLDTSPCLPVSKEGDEHLTNPSLQGGIVTIYSALSGGTGRYSPLKGGKTWPISHGSKTRLCPGQARTHQISPLRGGSHKT